MDKLLILNNIQEYYGFDVDARFAEFLDIPAQNLTKWKKRRTYNIELLCTKCTEISAEYIITGNGPIVKTESVIPAKFSEPNEEYKKEQSIEEQLLEKIKFQEEQLEWYRKQLDVLTKQLSEKNLLDKKRIEEVFESLQKIEDELTKRSSE